MDNTDHVQTEPKKNAPAGKKAGPGRRIRKWFARRKAEPTEERRDELPNFVDAVQPAMERMTDELISQTVGPDGVLTREFRAQIAQYDPNVNPISPAETRALISSLLDLAASRRKLLNERLERSVEVGALYKSYYGRIQTVDLLAAQAYTAMEHMELAEEDFHYHYAMLKKVRSKSVVPDMAPEDEELGAIDRIRQRMMFRKRDIMEVLDEMEVAKHE